MLYSVGGLNQHLGYKTAHEEGAISFLAAGCTKLGIQKKSFSSTLEKQNVQNDKDKAENSG